MLKVNDILFSYSNERIIYSTSFSLEKGKCLALIGESGCGKSTILKLLYGLYDLDEGKIFWGDNEVLGPKFNLVPGMDFIKYLAQDFDLMPFITVGENVGKYLSNIYKDKKQQRIDELLEIVEMVAFKNVKAKYLSGGQMQRVALARVLALEPELLLLDEPFSHIDNFRKNSLRRRLFAYIKSKEITTIVATHDSTDVLSFTDNVLVMKEGKVVDFGTPESIYKFPKQKYVASLFDDVNELNIDGRLQLLYPHQLKIVTHSSFKVQVVQCFYRGNHYLIEATFKEQLVYFESEIAIKVREEVCLAIKADGLI
ncbi:ABC transporter ATP-binding protein [Flavobacterium sp. SUN046]|uniref:ABC transporter ATP-binding protein n=1 Tax=Flavobacterium sp. SUN046 TaxID=3002440 RepID=UPI002DB6FBA9|nr:ABC transporter ATP-binding protein [Flavobacterium sp. SUN046]MEC4049814.1 ABC transporter ATP-binding protein [Flavobacterium sp. SUN046]